MKIEITQNYSLRRFEIKNVNFSWQFAFTIDE